ncbi:cytoplasmic chaperone TorD [Salmonella enterica]|nr:cytoplasmic chaperone TorD [Salmonella enterica]EBA9761785.1 helix-turn-helix domain-containing protein [Salmonella enterica]EEB5697283.1 cytoplasmic chaperone TorD [Salmonella enterica]ELF4899580.1 helix-turn-helix domain-containing protein [Salmonella enterica]
MKKNKSPEQEALEEAIEIAGGQSELARKITVKSGEMVRQQHVWNWLHREELPPAKKAIYIEMVTGVPKERLRPDIYPSLSAGKVLPQIPTAQKQA